jgi:hypothetical protein
VKESTSIELKDIPKGKYQMQIIDVTGRTVFEKTIQINLPYQKESLSLSHLSMGEYFLLISNANGRMVERFVKE